MRKVPDKDVAVQIRHHQRLRFMMDGVVDGGVSSRNFLLSSRLQPIHCGPYEVAIPTSIPSCLNWVISDPYHIMER